MKRLLFAALILALALTLIVPVYAGKVLDVDKLQQFIQQNQRDEGIIPPPITTYTLMISIPHVAGGTVTVNGIAYTAPRSFDSGTSVTIVATALSGHTFNYWIKDGIVLSTNPTYAFIINSDTTIAANFSDSVVGELGTKTNPIKLNKPYGPVSSGFTYSSSTSMYTLGAGRKVYFEVDPALLKANASAFQMIVNGFNSSSLYIYKAYYDKNTQTYTEDVYYTAKGCGDYVRDSTYRDLDSTRFLYRLDNEGASWQIQLWVQML